MAAFLRRHLFADSKFFEFNLKYLFYVGLWPKEHWTKTQKLLYKTYEYTLHILSLIYLAITGIGTYQHKDETAVFLANLDKSLVAYNFVIKVAIFMYKRNELKMLISEIGASGDTISDERKKLMSTHVIFITSLGTAVLLAFSALAQYKFEMTVEAWMPFDPLKNRTNLLLAAQIIAVTLVVSIYRSFAMQGIVCSLIMYICDQLIELQDKLRALHHSPETEADMRKAFKGIVKKHVRILGYSKSLDSIFQEFFLVQNLAVTVELCLNAMMITVVGLDEKKLLIPFLAFLGVALLNAYIYCYLGNEMITQSQGIALAAYETSWTSWPIDLQKDLLLVIRCAQRPLKLSAGGMAPMSIQTFSQALYNGYSIFAVLNDVVD